MSIYGAVRIGSCVMTPSMINGDYVSVDVGPAADQTDLADRRGGPVSPYIEDSALFIPVRMWESMQQATSKEARS